MMPVINRSKAAVITLTLFLTVAAAAKIAPKENEIVKPKDYRPLEMVSSNRLKSALDSIVGEVIDSYRQQGIKNEELAVTLIDLSDPARPRIADHRGEAKIYPASVVKMFYMAALYQQVEDRKVAMTKELERGLKDMIVDSSNEATQYIVDVLTNTSSGSELSQKEFDRWAFRRNRMNRYFASMGFTNINVNQKTHCEDAYGIEQQFRNYKGENRNMLTTNAAARLIAEIAVGRSVSAERSEMMRQLLKRDPFATGKDANSQATDFSGMALLEKKLTGARLWSKAGWTSRTRHDAAYIETPDGSRFAIAVFTENHANEKNVIPMIVSRIIDKLREV